MTLAMSLLHTVARTSAPSPDRRDECYLTGFQSLRPKYEVAQEQTIEWIAQAHCQSDRLAHQDSPEEVNPRLAQRTKRFSCSPEYIANRGTELSDSLHTNWNEMECFSLDRHPHAATLETRMTHFRKFASQAFEKLYPDTQNPPRDLLHVTCTGYVSPSPAQALVAQKQWGASTRVTHLYHMGCYAAFVAVRTGCAYLQLPDSFSNSTSEGQSRVDVVHTELSTLHIDPTQHAPEHVIIQTLFADGYSKYSVCNFDDAKKRGSQALRVWALKDQILPGSLDDMTWDCGSFGFKMTLSAKVPEKISTSVQAFLESLFASMGDSFQDLKEEVLFAIHPGGPKIIDQIQSVLNLREDQVAASRQVLKSYGNMSSATLPHVWQKILEDSQIPCGRRIVSLAFGPGLTMAGGVFQKVEL